MLITPTQLESYIAEYILPAQLQSINWSSLDQTSKLVALKRANKELNRLQFIGDKVSETQEDCWPRIISGQEVEIPSDVICALCQYVFDYIKILTDDRYDSIRAGVTSVKIGPISESYDKSAVKVTMNSYRDILADWIYRGGGYHGE